jgi:hypothetical protein
MTLLVLVGVHAVTVLLLLLLEGRASAAPRRRKRAELPWIEAPRVRAESRLVESVARWRTRMAGGEGQPPAAGTCRTAEDVRDADGVLA